MRDFFTNLFKKKKKEAGKLEPGTGVIEIDTKALLYGAFVTETIPPQVKEIHCECGNDLLKDEMPSLVRRAMFNGRDVIHFNCSICNVESFFSPTGTGVAKLPFSNRDAILDEYHKEYDK